MKIVRSKNILGILYACLLALPMVSILGRVIYTQSNKNAKDSYYGETINEVVYNQTTINDLKHNQEYLLDFNNVPTQSSSTNATDIACYELTIQTGTNVATFENVTIRMYVTSSSLQLYYQLLNYTPSTNGTITNQKITFKYNSIVTNTNATNRLLNNYLYSISYNQYSYLDNAFEYSLSKFVSDNDFGELNLFNWFGNLFLSNNSRNMLYIHFVNWYLNYAMFVSCIEILFLVLMWFVNYSRRLLERGMNYDW